MFIVYSRIYKLHICAFHMHAFWLLLYSYSFNVATPDPEFAFSNVLHAKCVKTMENLTRVLSSDNNISAGEHPHLIIFKFY